MENGAAYPDRPEANGEVEDRARIEYLSGHIESVGVALDRGVKVGGYFVWSLLDNFEWSRGYSKTVGIVHVDRATMQRTIKASGRWYQRFLTG